MTMSLQTLSIILNRVKLVYNHSLNMNNNDLTTGIRSDGKGFLNLFSEIPMQLELKKGNTINLFLLKIKNKRFDYDSLARELAENLITYSLSRREISTLIKEEKFNELVKKAKAKLRNHTSNDGELGELLLYCFLESHLNAPKLLSKLELKTSANDYVKGADGVHLLKLDDSSYQIIFGEAKMYSSESDAVTEAFDSIKKVKTSHNYSFERGLINSNLLKEVIDDDQYNFLKSILIPTEREQNTFLDDSFGVLIGFNYKIEDSLNVLDNPEFYEKLKEEVMEKIKKLKESIEKKIEENQFENFQFYFYFIPFTEIANVRKDIISFLQNE